MLRNRSTAEVLVLMLGGTVCLVLLAAGATVAFLEIRDASADTGDIVDTLDGIVQVLVGAVLGYLAHGGYVASQTPGASSAPGAPAPPERTEP